MINRLCIYCLLCHQVSSSLYSSLQNETADETIDITLTNFFGAIKLSYLSKRIPRHTTIIGGTENDVQQVQSILKIYPLIICRDIEKCSYSNQLHRGTFVVIFVDDSYENSFDAYVLILSKCLKCRILFVSDKPLKTDEIWSILSSTSVQYLQLHQFAHVSNGKVELYSLIFTTECLPKLKLVTTWRPGMILENFHTWSIQFMINLYGCPVFVSSLTFRPKMVIEENENGTLTVAGGREGKLILALAEKLNFTLVLKYPAVVDRMKFSRKTSIINDVVTGIAEIGIGRIRPTTDLYKVVAMSQAYDDECITWGVPRFVKWSNAIVWEELSWEVWSLVVLILGICSALAIFHQYVKSVEKGEQAGFEFTEILLDVFSMTLGNPAIRIFNSGSGRFILLFYLYYAIVLTTVYKTQLAAILATHEDALLIVDAEGMINANIKIGGSLYDYEILEDQANGNKQTLKILDKFLINNDDVKTIEQMKSDHDYAFLTRRSSLIYHQQKMIREKEPVTFNILNGCALTHPTEVVFSRKSWLRKPTDQIIQRLLESGIMEYWDAGAPIDIEKLLSLEKDNRLLRNRNVNKYHAVFTLYFCCIFLCLVVFLIEILIYKLNSREIH